MNFINSLSLRYKILLILTLLPLAMLLTYLLIAMNIFKTDKLAYVYESSSSVTKSLSGQFTTELNSILNISKPVMQEYLYKNKFDTISKGVFSVDNPIQWIAVYGVTGDGKVDEKSFKNIVKQGVKVEDQISQIKNYPHLITTAIRSGRILEVPFNDERILLVERVGENTSKMKIFVLLARIPDLANVFKTPGVNQNFLISDDGSILFGPSDSEIKSLNEKMGPDLLLHIKSQKFSTGAEGLKDLNGNEYLVSYAKAGLGGATVVSLVPQSEALKALKILVIRSVLFMIFLICMTIIISLFASGNLTAALVDLFNATKKVAEGHFDIDVKVKSHDEIGSLAESFNAMAKEVSRLLSETAEKARMESELKTAQTVQETLFPSARATIGDLKIAGFYEPASECGGDWWHYCEIQDKVFLWIGDATGHGAPAALITSAAKSAATIIEKLDVGPGEALSLLNRSIHDVSKGKIMMTFFLGCYDKKSKNFTYSNASHEAPYLIRKGSEPLKKKHLIPLNEVNNPRLGQARDTEYQETTIQLETGDRLFFYTDGLLDIQNPNKESWGEREFIKALVQSNSDFPDVDIAVVTLEEKFSEYRKGSPLIDDITFFMSECT